MQEPTFEACYRDYPFWPLVHLGLALARMLTADQGSTAPEPRVSAPLDLREAA